MNKYKQILEDKKSVVRIILILFIVGNALFFIGITNKIVPIDLAIIDVIIGIFLALWILFFKNRTIVIILFCLWVVIKLLNIIYIVDLLPVVYDFKTIGITFFILHMSIWTAWTIAIGVIFIGLIKKSIGQKSNKKQFIIPTNTDNVYERLQYLKDNEFTVKQLTSIHHFDKQTFSDALRYFRVNRDLHENNTKFANRVIFIADNHEKNDKDFNTLINKSLQKWPLN